MAEHLQAPRGTRDFYPADMARFRYVTEAFRQASLRHGFDEIEGPTFEHLDLYKVKSGEGIVSELFSFTRAGGQTEFALRPEFTPTLARMYAARARQLPNPTRWFSVGGFFRAERPQRGRLREFCQLNVDVLGGDDPVRADAEVIGCAVECFRLLGLGPEDVKIRISHRSAVEQALRARGVDDARLPEWFALLDKVGKISSDDYLDQARDLGMDNERATSLLSSMAQSTKFEGATTRAVLTEQVGGPGAEYFQDLFMILERLGVSEWCVINLGIVRGLAYYTGMVFEAHEASGKERAICGGGRYDTLVELFGGPPTPAVGFGMGDAVLSLVLEDRDLIPSERELGARLGTAPQVFCVAAGEVAESELDVITARLRRAGIRARRTFKATRNVGKMLKEASSAGGGARLCVILEDAGRATLKDLATGEQASVMQNELPKRCAAILAGPPTGPTPPAPPPPPAPPGGPSAQML